MNIIQAKSPTQKALCLKLRHQVFVVEQGVPEELEIDSHDEAEAIHFLGYIDDAPVASARLCVFGQLAKIQRVVVIKEYRGQSLGRMIMQHMMQFVRDNALAPTVGLDAQTYAVSFYEGLGFKPIGEEFDDAGIEHIHMVQPTG
jgi:predicted GNAT family N-acyltransferase